MLKMSKNINEVVIPRENAVFRLDGQGYWRNSEGRFRNKKIIDYFHSSIDRDEGGYFVRQDKGGVMEKVYFPYDDTALFVVDITFDPDIVLTLNTGKKCPLDPAQLFIRDDNLYVQTPGERIKFSERSLVKISEKIEESGTALHIRIGDERYPIAERPVDAGNGS
jgi:hypothetical protein